MYTKMLLHVSVNKPSSGGLLPCFAKVMIIKIFSPYWYACSVRRTAHSTHTNKDWIICSHTTELIDNDVLLTDYFNP